MMPGWQIGQSNRPNQRRIMVLQSGVRTFTRIRSGSMATWSWFCVTHAGRGQEDVARCHPGKRRRPPPASGGPVLVPHGLLPRPIRVQPDRGGMQRDSLLPFPNRPNDLQCLGLEAGPSQEVPSADGKVMVVPRVQDRGKPRRARVPFP